MNSQGKSDYEQILGHRDVPGFTFQQPFVQGKSAKDPIPEKMNKCRLKQVELQRGRKLRMNKKSSQS